mmetsp:Transcript_13564/g.32759  ORF Transcript_13564/g.32759 Transcript_13564/m.32759 type:complete len:325 (+) Transcript_13564:337-1311(+)
MATAAMVNKSDITRRKSPECPLAPLSGAAVGAATGALVGAATGALVTGTAGALVTPGTAGGVVGSTGPPPPLLSPNGGSSTASKMTHGAYPMQVAKSVEQAPPQQEPGKQPPRQATYESKSVITLVASHSSAKLDGGATAGPSSFGSGVSTASKTRHAPYPKQLGSSEQASPQQLAGKHALTHCKYATKSVLILPAAHKSDKSVGAGGSGGSGGGVMPCPNGGSETVSKTPHGAYPMHAATSVAQAPSQQEPPRQASMQPKYTPKSLPTLSAAHSSAKLSGAAVMGPSVLGVGVVTFPNTAHGAYSKHAKSVEQVSAQQLELTG